MATEGDTPPQVLADLLLAFGAAPGQYPVRLGEPRLLYRELDTVATWAIGKVPAALHAQAGALAEAAVLFVLRACFANGNTHYQVLGLPAGTIPPESLRSRYRALIRLTHPDMAVQGLPSDAAGIVNRAHEVLSTPALRAAYDEQLADRAAAVPPRARVRPEVARIEHRVGWGERLASWAARYPGPVRAVATAVVVVLAGGVLLWWAARDGDHGRMLVVAEAPSPLGSEAKSVADPAKPSTRPPLGMTTAATPPKSTAPATLLRDDLPRAASANQPPLGKAALASAMPAAPPPAPAQGRLELSTAAPAAPPSPAPPPALASITRAAPPPVWPSPPAPAEVPRVAAVTLLPAARQPTVSIPPVDAAGAAAPQPPAVPAQRTSPPPPVAETRTGAAPQQSPTAPRVWTVDTVGSLDYLNDLIGALERPAKARQANRYLADMRVKGSLLQPALQLMNQYPTIAVEKMDWTDSERPGVLNVRGTVVLQASGRQTTDTRWVRYRLTAEFWGTRDGTVLAVLDLRESD